MEAFLKGWNLGIPHSSSHSPFPEIRGWCQVMRGYTPGQGGLGQRGFQKADADKLQPVLVSALSSAASCCTLGPWTQP